MTKFDYSIYEGMTKGEWLVDPDNITMVVKLVNNAYQQIVDTEDGSLHLTTDEEEANGRAIASLPSLIKHAKELEEENVRLRDVMEEIREYFDQRADADQEAFQIQSRGDDNGL